MGLYVVTRQPRFRQISNKLNFLIGFLEAIKWFCLAQRWIPHEAQTVGGQYIYYVWRLSLMGTLPFSPVQLSLEQSKL